MINVKSYTKNNTQNIIYTLIINLLLLFIWLISPVLSIPIIFTYLFFFSNSITTRYIYFFLLATVPALINATKTPESDLLEYYLLYKSLFYIPFDHFLEEIQRDQFFYFISMILSKGSDATNQVFILFWTTLTYFLTFISLSIFAENLESYNKKILVGVVFYTLLLGISFTISGHIVRQYAAASFLLLGIVMLINQKKSSLFFIFSAFFSHWSTFLYAIAFILSWFKWARSKTAVLFIVIGAFLIGSSNILNLIMPYLLAAELNTSSEVSIMAERAVNYADHLGDGALGIRQLFLLLISSIFALYLYFTESNEKVRFMLFFILFTLSLILLTRNNPLLFLRYSFFFEFFLPFLLLIILTNYWHKQFVRLIFYATLLIAPIKFIRSLQGSNWTYISNDYSIIINTILDMFHYLK